MTGNTSATGGYLAPENALAPTEDDALVDFLQSVIVGVSGVPGQFVRPRWQPEPPNLPPRSTTWIALGIDSRQPDTYAYVDHGGDAPGADNLQRHEVLNLRASIYGPAADSTAARIRDGLQIAQNREALQLANMGLVQTGNPIAVPSLVKEQWLYRVDLTIAIRRLIQRNYPVLNLVTAHGDVTTGVLTDPINVHD